MCFLGRLSPKEHVKMLESGHDPPGPDRVMNCINHS